MATYRRRKAAIFAATGLVAVALGIVLVGWRTTRGTPPLIAVDVGHSTADGGAVSATGIDEFVFNQELARTVEATFARRNVAFVSVGLDGSMPDFRMRPPFIASSGATFVLSIHHDSVNDKYLETWTRNGAEGQYSDRFAGFSLFVSRGNAQLPASLACASAIGAALVAAGFTPTAHHAEDIEGERKPWADQPNGVYYYDNLHVQRVATVPAVLLEAGVIVNRDEEAMIRTVETRQKIATAVSAGLAACGQIPAD